MSEYVIYTDKNEDFECTVNVTGASLQGSLARLVLEVDDDFKLVFDGKVVDKRCVIPVKRLPGILEEGMTGRMKLELIVEDTYFAPWRSEFVVKSSKKVSVLVKENTEDSIENKRPKIEISNISSPAQKSKVEELGKNHKKDIFMNSKVDVPRQTKLQKPLQEMPVKKKDVITEKIAFVSEKLSYELLANDINAKNMGKNTKQIKEVFEKFFHQNSDLVQYKDDIIKKTMKSLIEEK
jgi:hypothetical protein